MSGCIVVLVDASDRTFPLSLFRPFFEAAIAQRKRDEQAARELRARVAAEANRDGHITQRAIEVANELDQRRDDRSGRDFWVVCQLIRFGLDDSQIRSLVTGRSKFVRPKYTELTLARAHKAVGR